MFKNQVILFFLLLCCTLNAQNDEKKIGTKEKDTTKKISFVPIPYINYDRAGGFEFGAVPMAMYKISKTDTISPQSLTGVLGKYSTEKNWVVIAFQRLYLKEDHWRITFGGGIASNGFQFFSEDAGGGSFIDYRTAANFFHINIQRKIYKKLYGGISYTFVTTDTKFDDPFEDEETVFHALGFSLALDTRSSVYYPYTGFLTNIKWYTTPEFFDNEFVSNKIDIDYNRYFPFYDKRDVFAARAYMGFGLGDLAFEQQFIVQDKDIRGYTQGKYRGENIASIQAEYRYNPFSKIGFVGFGGFATIWNAPNESDNGIILPSIGAGMRYNVFPKNHLNVGLEAAFGRDDWGIYFKIGEAF